MSTSTAKSFHQPPPQAPQPPRLSPGEEIIAAAIRDAQAALWRAELSRSLLSLVIATLVVLVVWAVVDQWVWSPGPLIRLLVLLAGVCAVAAWVTTRILPLLRSRIRADYAAYSIEHDLPELRHALTSYVSLREDVGMLGPRGAIVRSIGARAAGQMKQHRLDVPSEATGTFHWWIGLAVALAATAAYGLLSPKNTLQSTQRLLLPLASIDAPTRVTIREVRPGDCEVLSDRPLEISAEIDGLISRDEPAIQYGLGFAQRQTLQLDSSSGRFIGTIRVPRSTQYRIAAGDALVGPFDIIAHDVPVASVRGVQIVPPPYTQLPTRHSTGGAVTAEENSQVTVTATINRPIERARLEFNPRKTVERSGPSAGSVEMQIAEDGLSATATVPLRLPRDKHAAVAIDSYRVRVWDADGNDNPDPIVYPVRIIPDLPPEVSIVSPREVAKEIPINAQQLLEIAALDPDYGLRRIELTWQRGADLPTSEILWSSAQAARGNQVTEYRFRPASLGLRVGDKLLLSAVAIDNREDLKGNADANRSQTQPIELLIVAAQQLPPVSAPEDGLSEPDDEPASGGRSQQGEQGSEGAQDGQAGGGSAGGGDASAGDDEQQGGQSGSGSGQSDDQRSQAENQASGDGQPADSSSASNGAGQGTAEGSSSQAGAPQEGNPAPSSESMSNSEPGTGSNSNNDNNETANRQVGEPGANNEPANSASTGEQSSDGSATGTAQSAPSSNNPSGDSTADDSSTSQRSDSTGNGTNGQNSSDSEPSNREPSAPPEHDGDAFERIRDYLNQKQQQPPSREQTAEPSTQPSGQSPEQNEPTDGSAGKQSPPSERSSQGGADPSKTDPAAGKESAPSGESAADPMPGDSGVSDAGRPQDTDPADAANGENDAASPAGEDESGQDAAAKQGTTDQQDPVQRPQPSDADAAAGDMQSGTDGGQSDPSDQQRPPESPNQNDGAQPKGTRNDGAGAQPQHDGGAAESGATPDEAGSSGQPQPSSNTGSPAAASGEQSGEAPGQSSSGDGGNSNVLGTGGQGVEHDARPPDPVDLEHARQATDLVLDYLEQTRDTPDPELLERLNWTPEELRDFTDRWRELLKSQRDSGAGADQQQIEETLRSLGIRKPAEGPIGASRGRDDALRGLRDGGNRPPPPTLYRDAFDAFRRGLGRP